MIRNVGAERLNALLFDSAKILDAYDRIDPLVDMAKQVRSVPEAQHGPALQTAHAVLCAMKEMALPNELGVPRADDVGAGLGRGVKAASSAGSATDRADRSAATN